MTNLPFERKSKVNTSRDNYLDANGNVIYAKLYEGGVGNCASLMGSGSVRSSTLCR